MDEVKNNSGHAPPMVSVCVQTYRHVKFIEQCLESILSQQTKFRYEIIVGEDESDDGTRDICIRYAEQYPEKIRLFLRSRKDVIKINGKETGRHNFKENLKSCQGKYIAICEGDDYWTDPMKLQKQVDFLESHTDYSLCFHPVQILKDDQLVNDYITVVPAETTTLHDLAKGNYIHTPTCMFKRGLELPRWFDEVLAGDYALHILNAQRGKLFCLPEVMAVYRIHGGGLWSTNKEGDNQLKWLSVLTTLCAHLTGETKDILANQRLDWAITLQQKGHQETTLPILQHDVLRLLERYLKLSADRERLLTDPEYLEEKVSGTFLTKAILKKIRNKANKKN